MSRQLCSYPLSVSQLILLQKHGFLHSDDVTELSPTELSKELQISCKDALDIFKLVKDDLTTGVGAGVPNKSAFELLKEEEQQLPIVTFCALLDDILGGGIPMGKITEICGAPGMGKTQFGMQLVVDVQIPEVFGGVEGEAIYIDCEGSFICERLVEIAAAAVTHIESVADNNGEDAGAVASNFNVNKILNGIHVYRCHDYVKLLALSHVLPDVLENNKKVKLIVLDSIAFHFRYDFEDMGLRTKLLHNLVQSFMRMAYEHNLAVVFMNQMTTKISHTEEAKLVPALGQSWGHACTIRIILDSKNGQRYAHLFKSPNHEDATVPFEITKDGIRDVNANAEEITQPSFMAEEKERLIIHNEMPAKRQKLD